MRNWKRLSFMFSSHSSPVESGLDEKDKEAKKPKKSKTAVAASPSPPVTFLVGTLFASA